MEACDYASSIPGCLLLREKTLPLGNRDWEFKITSGFSPESARRLLSELPEGCQLHYPEPDRFEPSGEWYVFIRRHDGRFFSHAVTHGRDLPWSEAPLEVVLQAFVSSRLIREPTDSPFPSFTISSMIVEDRYTHLPL
jgi:hypothetical protein